jgi:hypothetical protein
MGALSTPKEQRPADYIVYIDDMPVRRALSFDVTPNFNPTEYSEIGSSAIIESVPGIISTSVTMNTNSLGTVDLFGKIMGEKAAKAYGQTVSGYPGTTNSSTFTEADFETACVDLLQSVREDGTNLRRTTYVPNCYLSSFSFTFPVDGAVTENYTFVGDSDYDFIGTNYADARVKVGNYSALVTTGMQLSGLAAMNTALYTGILASVGGVIVATGNNVRLVSGTLAATGTMTFDSNCGVTAVNSGDRCRLVYGYIGGDTWANKVASGLIGVPGKGGVMGYQCRAYITSGTATSVPIGSNELSLRVQNVTINGDLGRDESKELGNIRSVSKKLTTPLRITATVDVNDNDLEMYAKLCGGTTWTTFSGYKYSSQDVYLAIDSSMFSSNSKLVVEMYNSRSGNFASTNKLSMITLSGLSVTAKTKSTSSSARGTMSYSLQGSYISVSGYNVANV